MTHQHRSPERSGRHLLAIVIFFSATACTSRILRTFDAPGITTVVVRAANASGAVLQQSPDSAVQVAGTARGGARGYHSPDPNWRETPASQWGLDFVAKQYGPVLIVSTKNEIRYIHHSYYLDELQIAVPKGVDVRRVDRELTGKGDPDLSPP